MIDLTNLDERLQAHTTRVARIDRTGWMLEAPTPAAGNRTNETETFWALCRRSVNLFRRGNRPNLADTSAASTAHQAGL